MQFSLSFFYSISCFLVFIVTTSFPTPRVQRFTPVFLLKSSDLLYRFRLMTHFDQKFYACRK